MKNNPYAPKKTGTGLRRIAAAALALALCLCALPVTVFAEDAPSRPQSAWIRAEEVAVYPQVEQWSSLYGRDILVPGPYAGAGLSVKLEGVDSDCKYTGFTPGKYLTQVRIENAKLLLRQGQHSIQFISDACGFANANYFARVFRTSVGMNPRDYAREQTLPSGKAPEEDRLYVL